MKGNGDGEVANRCLTTDVLRGEWGFDGLVVSDWGAVHDRVAALAAGLDLEMPPNLGVSDHAIVEAVSSGRLDMAGFHSAGAGKVPPGGGGAPPPPPAPHPHP